MPTGLCNFVGLCKRWLVFIPNWIRNDLNTCTISYLQPPFTPLSTPFACRSSCLSIFPLPLPIHLSDRQTVCLSFFLSALLSVRPSDILSVYVSVCLSFRLSIRLSVFLSFCLFVCLSVYLSVCLFICLSSICFSVCLSVSLSVYLFLCMFFDFMSSRLSVTCLPKVFRSIHVSVCLLVFLFFVSPSVCAFILSLYIWLSFCRPICFPVNYLRVSPCLSLFYLSTGLSSCLSVCLSFGSVCPSVCLSLSIFIKHSVSFIIECTRFCRFYRFYELFMGTSYPTGPPRQLR